MKLSKYGNIGDWDTSLITDMSGLFSSLSHIKADQFNQDIGSWNAQML